MLFEHHKHVLMTKKERVQKPKNAQMKKQSKFWMAYYSLDR